MAKKQEFTSALKSKEEQQFQALSKTAELKIMLWLRSREWLGNKRKHSRLFIYPALLLCWIIFLTFGSVYAAKEGTSSALSSTRSISTACWFLWALIPFLSGGAGEVQSGNSLAPYPVSTRGHLISSWVSAFLDFPYIIAFPPLFASAVAAGGVKGAIAAILFTLSASTLGQAGAWALSGVLAKYTKTVRTFSLIIVSALALIGIVAISAKRYHLTGILPTNWLLLAIKKNPNSILYYLAMLFPIALYIKFGTKLVKWALGQEKSQEKKTSTVKVIFKPKSLNMLLFLSFFRSILRSNPIKITLTGLLFIPFATTFAQAKVNDKGSLSYASHSLNSVTNAGMIAALALGATLAINVFSYDGGGMSLLFSSPLEKRKILITKYLVIYTALFCTQIGVELIACLLIGAKAGALLGVIIAIALRTALLAALGIRWSVKHPLGVDLESLRSKLAPPRSVLTFFPAAIITANLCNTAVKHWSFTNAALSISLLLLATWLFFKAERDLKKEGSQNIVTAVSN